MSYTSDNNDHRTSPDSPYVRLGGHNCYTTVHRPGKTVVESKLWKSLQGRNSGSTTRITREGTGESAYVKILAADHVRTDSRFGLISRNFHMLRQAGVAYVFSIYAIANTIAAIKVEGTNGRTLSVAPGGYDSTISTSSYGVTEVRVLNPRIPVGGLDVRLVIEVDSPTAGDYICFKYVLFGEAMASIVGDHITMSYGDRTVSMSFDTALTPGENAAAGTVTEYATSITSGSNLLL